MVDHSLSLQVFLYLQALDLLTSWAGLRLGLSEGSQFVRMLLQFGTLNGLLGSKLIAALLGAYCVHRGRYAVIRVINYWFAGLVAWNLTLISVVS